MSIYFINTHKSYNKTNDKNPVKGISLPELVPLSIPKVLPKPSEVSHEERDDLNRTLSGEEDVVRRFQCFRADCR